MRAYVETLPQSCLLTLCADEAGRYSLAAALRHALRHALRSHYSCVWVDCRQLTSLPTEVVLVLRQYASQLWQHGGHLILCHLPEAARAHLLIDTSQPLAACLLDARQYGLDCPTHPAS